MTSFELTIKETIHDEATGTIRLQVWVSQAPEEYDPNVFVYQDLPPVPESGLPADRFVHIASYADMYSFQPTNPDPELPYFRKYYYDMLFDSSEKMEETQEMTQTYITQLLKDISRKDNIPLATLTVITI